MKLINNLVLGSFMATLSEAIAIGEHCGISKAQVIEILQSGAGNSMILNVKKQKLLDEDFSPHFSNSLIYKDLQYLQELCYYMKKNQFLLEALLRSFLQWLLQNTFQRRIFQVFINYLSIFRGKKTKFFQNNFFWNIIGIEFFHLQQQ